MRGGRSDNGRIGSCATQNLNARRAGGGEIARPSRGDGEGLSARDGDGPEAIGGIIAYDARYEDLIAIGEAMCARCEHCDWVGIAGIDHHAWRQARIAIIGNIGDGGTAAALRVGAYGIAF